jgi:single-stranded DNA-binding protein
MPSTTNKAILVGTLGRSPERGEGTGTVTFTLATRAVDPDSPQWHLIRLEGRIASFAMEYLKKGDRVYVEGPLVYVVERVGDRSYSFAEIHCKEIVILNGRDNDLS